MVQDEDHREQIWGMSGGNDEADPKKQNEGWESEERADDERTLSEREASLDARERDVQNTQNEIDATLRDLVSLREALRLQIDQMDVERDAQNEQLSTLLESMEAASAANILAEAPIPLALDILTSMDSSRASQVLGEMEPGMAAELVHQSMISKQQE